MLGIVKDMHFMHQQFNYNQKYYKYQAIILYLLKNYGEYSWLDQNLM